MGRDVGVRAVLGGVGVGVALGARGAAFLGGGNNDQRRDGLGKEGTDGLGSSHSASDGIFTSNVDSLARLLSAVGDALSSRNKGSANRAENVTLGLGLVGLGRSVLLGCLGGRGRCRGSAKQRKAPALGLGRLLTVGRRAAGPVLGWGPTGMGSRMSRRGAAGRAVRRNKIRGEGGKGQHVCTVSGESPRTLHPSCRATILEPYNR